MLRRILGFSHFRTDLGDGLRTGVFFDSCSGKCSDVCVPHKFLKEHPFAEDTCEDKFYTEDDLLKYLAEEKVWCYTKPLGITFLGHEPLYDPDFCLTVGKGIREMGMSLNIWTCGNFGEFVFDMLSDVTDLFVVHCFVPAPVSFKPYQSFDVERVLFNIRYIDKMNYPFRLRIPIIAGLNDNCSDLMADFAETLPNLKSVILDFSNICMKKDEVENYRRAFLSKKIPLY